MEIAFICTVLNEEDSIKKLFESIFRQTKLPDEIIVADGGSTDKTVEILENFQKESKIKIKILKIKGNRSKGRNAAIGFSRSQIIACSDAGCILDRNWLKRITAPIAEDKAEVVAGYYKGIRETIIQKCLIPYVLVMPDRVNPKNFLPATRSMAFTKNAWGKVGKFREDLSNNEDYEFARRLGKKFKIIFVGDAVVSWIPPGSLTKAFVMFYRFALGDSESRILRPKVILIFARYLLGIFLLILAIIERSQALLIAILSGLSLYLVWSVIKNYKYVNDKKSIFYLPVIQILSDMAVALGTLKGLWVIQSK